MKKVLLTPGQVYFSFFLSCNRDTKRGIADIFVKKGPFLKLYTSYIRDFETMTATLDEAVKKHTAFQAALKEFEVYKNIAIKRKNLKKI